MLPLRPWYAEPWPWLLMLGPVAAILMGVLMVTLAIRSEDGLVAEDYYKQGLAVNRVLERERYALAAGVAAELSFDDARRHARIELRMTGPRTERLILTLVHPTRSGHDQTIVLTRLGEGYEGALAVPVAGRWRLVLENPERTWRVTGLWHTGEPRVTLQPRPDER